ncbi:MAG: hypothetical protein NC124_21085 [Clostridium sp.]|nr:hypothetical protein [Clostridium sp.]
MALEDKRQRKVTISKIMTPIVMLLFILVLLFLVNFHSFCHFCNRNSYEAVTATVTQKTTDPFVMLVPMVRIKYEYQGKAYEDRKYFFLQPFFGLPSEEGSKLTIYVNKEAPGYSIFKENFFRNMINWILLVFEGVFVSLLIRRIRQGFRIRKQRKAENKRD